MYRADGPRSLLKKIIQYSYGGLAIVLGGILIVAAFQTLAAAGSAQEDVLPSERPEAKVLCWGFLSAAIATGVGSVAGGIAVAYVGAAAMGAVAERPELLGRSLIFVGLAEGIAIYGLIIALRVLGILGELYGL